MSERRIRVSLENQRLELFDSDKVLKTYRVSTSKNGAGESVDSFKTPRGRHVIRAKIGDGSPE